MPMTNQPPPHRPGKPAGRPAILNAAAVPCDQPNNRTHDPWRHPPPHSSVASTIAVTCFFGMIMKRTALFILATSAALVCLAGTTRAHDRVDKTKAAAFDNRMFAGPPGQKAYACFVRRYDASHLAQHPKQKVSAMKLLVTAEVLEDAKQLNYSFRLGVTYRHRTGNFDSSGFCSHIVAENTDHEIRLGCGVDC